MDFVGEIIAAVAVVLAALIAAGYFNRQQLSRRSDEYSAYETVIDDMLSVIRDAYDNGKSTIRAMEVLSRLKPTHDMDAVIVAFYILRRRNMIEWEKDNILKPDHMISFVHQ